VNIPDLSPEQAASAADRLLDGQLNEFDQAVSGLDNSHPWLRLWKGWHQSQSLEFYLDEVTPTWDAKDRHLLVPLLTCLSEQACWCRRYSLAEKLAKRAIVRSTEQSADLNKTGREIQYSSLLAHLALTRVYAYQQRYDLSHRLLDYLDREHAAFVTDIAFGRSEILRLQGELPFACVQLARAQRHNPNHPFFEARRAWLLIDAQKYDEAQFVLDTLKNHDHVAKIAGVRDILERILAIRQSKPFEPLEINWTQVRHAALIGNFKRLTLLAEIAFAQGQHKELVEMAHTLVRPSVNGEVPNNPKGRCRPSPWVPYTGTSDLTWLNPHFGLPLGVAYWPNWKDFSWGGFPKGFFPWPITSIDSQDDWNQDFLRLLGFGAQAFRAMHSADHAKQIAQFVKTVRNTEGTACLVNSNNPNMQGASSIRVEFKAAARKPRWIAIESANGNIDYCHAESSAREAVIFFPNSEQPFREQFFAQKLEDVPCIFHVIAKEPSTAALDSFHFCIWIGFTQGPPLCLPVLVERA
jgi:tetratricopeptide (TPR) repeat protein